MASPPSHSLYWGYQSWKIKNVPNISTKSVNEIDLDKIIITDLPWINGDECPFYFAKASSTHAQQIFLGAPKESVLNFERLKMFNCTSQSINKLPHIY